MELSRTKKAKLNIVFSILNQIIALICGLIIPALMLKSFGSEAYGATVSIGQFLSYITLLEAGVGGVARASLYKPIANKDSMSISSVLYEVRRFFAIVGLVFLIYTLIIACSFKSISHIECFDWTSSFLLVLIISISTFAEYFIGITYRIFLIADQKTYIINIADLLFRIANTVLVILLIFFGSSLIIVKLVSGLVFTLKPIVLFLYVRRKYSISTKKGTFDRDKNVLSDKWEGLGQHIAFVLHSNTDVVVLTLFDSLKAVAVYSIYNMVVSSIQNLTTSFANGMEALFGDLLAKNELNKLHTIFGYYETMISMISIFLFSVASVTIVPFVRLYTADINDAEYIVPLFGMLLLFSALLFCLEQPYHAVVIAAGHFKQTRVAAYGEAIINTLLSITLVFKFGLIGVAIGTVTATLFRFVYYAWYLKNTLIYRDIKLFLKRVFVNSLTFGIICVIGYLYINRIIIENYLSWACSATIVSMIAILVIVSINIIYYKQDCCAILNKIKSKV